MPPTINCPFTQKQSTDSGHLIQIWNRIDDVPQNLIDWMTEDGEIHLNPRYLKALERSGMRGFNQYIAGFRNDEGYIGFSVFQVVDMESDEPSGYLSIVPAYKLLFPKTQHTGKGIRARVLVGGDVFGTGVKLFRFNPEVTSDNTWSLIRDAGREISKQEKESLDFWLIKDFVKGESPHQPAQKKASLTAVKSEPLMVLFTDPNWVTFDDYLTAMKTKYRTKAKAAMKRSAGVRSELWSLDEVVENSSKMISLYEQIWCQASFRPGKINEQVLINWKREMQGNCKVKAYFLEDELVGFQLGFFQNDVLDAILVGFNLDLNRKYSLLESMLLEFVSWGIDEGVREIRYGRTAAELKSTIGAVPIPAFGMVRHGKSTLNRVVKWVGPMLKPKPGPIRTPFKQDYYQRIIEPGKTT